MTSSPLDSIKKAARADTNTSAGRDAHACMPAPSSTSFRVTDTRTVSSWTLPQQQPRDDIDFGEQYVCHNTYKQQCLLDAQMMDFESTLASVQTHVRFVQMLLGEAYRYRLTRVGNPVRYPGDQPPLTTKARQKQVVSHIPYDVDVEAFETKLKRKINRIWAACLHRISLCAEQGKDPYPDVLQTVSRFHLWEDR